MARDDESISFRFTGGDADDGRLNFYDASRFYYGAARFIYTLEYFRQTGTVLSKITTRVNAEYLITAPREGSWILDVLHDAGPVVAECAIKVPMEGLISFVMERLTPGTKSREMLAQLAQEQTAQARERTAQERERTKQIQALTKTNEQALKLVADLANAKVASDEQTRQVLNELKREITASKERERVIEPYKREFDRIPGKAVDRLVDRTSTQVVEMGKPLIRSASELSITSGRKRSVANLNRRSIEQLSGNVVDPIPTTLVGDLVRYDKENGWGKFRNPVFSKPVSFVVPSSRKSLLNLEVIEAMKEDKINVAFYYVRDRRGAVRYLVFDHLLEIEE
jgi:hypothetical protein